MTPRKAKELLEIYFGHAAVNAFDPLWPETMLGVAPGAQREEVFAALRARLFRLADHAHDEDAHLLGRVLRSVAAQMIDGPGAEWTPELETELDPARTPRSHADEHVVARLPAEPVASQTERNFRRQARALVATGGTTSRIIAQLYALAEADGLPPAAVDRFLSELVTPVESDEPVPRPQAGAARARYDFQTAPEKSGQGVWLAVGAVVTLAVVAFSIVAIVAITKSQNTPPTPQPTQPVGASGPDQANTPVQPVQPAQPAAPVRRTTPTADGPPDGRVFARELYNASSRSVSAAERERVVLAGVETLRKWWPRIDHASRAAAVQALAAGAVELSLNEASRASLLAALKAKPADPTAPGAVWHVSATAGLAAVLSRERELPATLQQACREVLAATLGGTPSARRAGSTFDEAAVEALQALPSTLLSKPDQPSAVTRAQADYWLTALRAATGLGGSSDEAARRTDVVALDAVERLLTSSPNASERRPVFEFASALLAQVRFREGDPGRDRVLVWLSDSRLSIGDVHLITAAVATKSAAAGVEPTMVLSAGTSPADRDDLRVRYAEAWSKAANAARAAAGGGGANADWYEAARAAVTQAGQATGDLEQLAAAAALANLNQAASLRSRGLPAPVVVKQPPAFMSGTITIDFVSGGNGDGEWARRFLAESRTAAARLGRIAEFEQLPSPGPIDCEVLAETALLSTGETRAAAQRAALKRTEHPAMVNAVLEVLPKVKRSSNAGGFLGQFSLAGALPSSNDRWAVHYRRALIERLLTLLAASNSTVAADQASAVLAEAWTTVSGTQGGEVSDTDGPTESVNAASRAYTALITQIRQQVPAPTALIHPDVLDRTRAGRLLVAHGLPQAFAANQVSAVEALAVIVAAERPASGDQCRALIAELGQERAAARSVAAQIRAGEAAAMKLWAIRLGEPL